MTTAQATGDRGHVLQTEVGYAGYPYTYRPTCSCGWVARLASDNLGRARDRGPLEHPAGRA
jgi:hypothetical protein